MDEPSDVKVVSLGSSADDDGNISTSSGDATFNVTEHNTVVQVGEVIWSPSGWCRAGALFTTSLLLFGSYFAYDSISALSTALRMLVHRSPITDRQQASIYE
jgi:hypothetical protein